MSFIFSNFVFFLKKIGNEMPELTQWNVQLRQKVDLETFFKHFIDFKTNLFETEMRNEERDGLKGFEIEFDKIGDLDVGNRPNSYLAKLKQLLSFRRQVRHQTCFELFMLNFENKEIREFPRNELDEFRSLNSFLDFIGSNYFGKYIELSREYYIQKLYNRICLVYKKEMGEEELFEKESTIVFAKLISLSESILSEEFYHENCFEIDQQMLLQKWKLSFYIKKNHQRLLKTKGSTEDRQNEQSQEEQQTEEKEYALNQSFIGKINLDSLKTIHTTNLFLNELHAVEMLGVCIKELAIQTD